MWEYDRWPGGDDLGVGSELPCLLKEYKSFYSQLNSLTVYNLVWPGDQGQK